MKLEMHYECVTLLNEVDENEGDEAVQGLRCSNYRSKVGFRE